MFAYQGLQQLSNRLLSDRYYLFSRASPLEHQCLRKAYPRLGNMDLKEDDCSDK